MIASLILTLGLMGKVNFDAEIRLGKAAVPNQNVRIVGFLKGTPKMDQARTTNAAGRVRFQVDDREEMWVVVTTEYEGLRYNSPIFSSQKLPREPVIIEVFKVKENPTNLHVDDIRLSFRDNPDGLQVDQTIVIQNPESAVVIGSKTDKAKALFSFVVPDGAFNLKFTGGFDEQNTRFEGNTILITSPLQPGFNPFSLSYTLEKSSTSMVFSQDYSLPLQKVSMAISDPIRIEGLSLQAEGQKLFEGKPLSLYSASLAGQSKLSLQLKDLNYSIPFSKWLAPLGGLILLILLFALSGRKSSKLDPAEKQKLLRELLILKRSKDQGLITETQFKLDRLRLLEALVPHYS